MFLYGLLFCVSEFPLHKLENTYNTRNHCSLKFSEKQTHNVDPSDKFYLAQNNIEKEPNKNMLMCIKV